MVGALPSSVLAKMSELKHGAQGAGLGGMGFSLNPAPEVGSLLAAKLEIPSHIAQYVFEIVSQIGYGVRSSLLSCVAQAALRDLSCFKFACYGAGFCTQSLSGSGTRNPMPLDMEVIAEIVLQEKPKPSPSIVQLPRQLQQLTAMCILWVYVVVQLT